MSDLDDAALDRLDALAANAIGYQRGGALTVLATQVRALIARVRAAEALAKARAMRHLYFGMCPDGLQPDSRDPQCGACRALAAAGAPHEQGG